MTGDNDRLDGIIVNSFEGAMTCSFLGLYSIFFRVKSAEFEGVTY